MKEATLRDAIGIGLIIAHFGVIALVFYYWTQDGFKFAEMTTSVGLLAPMFIGYTSAVIAYFVKNAGHMATRSRRVNLPFVFISCFFPIVFTGALVSITIMRAHSIGFADFEQYKITLALVESCFAVYLAKVVTALFGEIP